MNEFVDAIVSLDFDNLLVLIRQVIDNPLANLEAALLLLIGLVVATLLAIVIAILVIGFREEDDEEVEGDVVGEEAPARDVRRGRTRPTPAERREREPRPPLTPAERRWRFVTGALFTTVAIVAAWLLTGVTTGIDSMCLSCHGGDLPHQARMTEGDTSDPHRGTGCVDCHETGGWGARVTTNVPARAAHFAQGIAEPDAVAGYGSPVAARACSRCHGPAIAGVTVNEDRGLRMSHAEPLASGGTCMDCHEMQNTSGVIGAWTVGMSSCLRCHDNEQASAECDSCHTKDIAYAVHVNFEPKPKRLVPDTRCGSCHDETKCDACHGLRMPHSEEFKSVTHPREATLDIWYNNGATCKKCHTETRNPCTSCHRRIGPGHPVTQWPQIHGLGGPDAGYTGCNGCHGYLASIQGRNFCGTCHEEYVGYGMR